MKKVYFFIFVIIILTVGIIIPKVFIHDKIQPKNDYPCTRGEYPEDPIVAVQVHFDHPLQRLVTLKTIISGETNGAILVSGYTFFGIKLTEAEYNCEGIKTVSIF